MHSHHHHGHLFRHEHTSHENSNTRAGMSGLRASQRVLESKQYRALSQWLSGHSKSVGDALDSFCEPVEDRFFQTENASDAEAPLWTTWQAAIGEAAATSHTSPQRQKLVDFVVNLTSRPTLSKGDSLCQIDGMTVWRDLPVFGWELREAWNLGKHRTLELEPRISMTDRTVHSCFRQQ